MLDIAIREMKTKEINSALALAWSVFLEFEAPDYTKEGVDEFYKSIHDEEYLAMLRIYGAYDDGKLVGVLATRSEGAHIALFFVERNHQRQGIGKQLFQFALKDCKSEVMTVNSSPYAVPVYHKLGFADTDTQQITNGLKYTPMKMNIKSGH